MDKREIKRQLESYTGGCFITKRKLADALGLSHAEYADKYLKNLDKVSGKYYLIDEVAAKLALWKE